MAVDIRWPWTEEKVRARGLAVEADFADAHSALPPI